MYLDFIPPDSYDTDTQGTCLEARHYAGDCEDETSRYNIDDPVDNWKSKRVAMYCPPPSHVSRSPRNPQIFWAIVESPTLQPQPKSIVWVLE